MFRSTITFQVQTTTNKYNISGYPEESVQNLLEKTKVKILNDHYHHLTVQLNAMGIAQSVIDQVVSDIKQTPDEITSIFKKHTILMFSNSEIRYHIRGENGEQKQLEALNKLKYELLNSGIPTLTCDIVSQQISQSPARINEILREAKIFFDGALLSLISSSNNLTFSSCYPEKIISKNTTLGELEKEGQLHLFVTPDKSNQKNEFVNISVMQKSTYGLH